MFNFITALKFDEFKDPVYMSNMNIEIKKAIASHIQWKKELTELINTGNLQTPVDIIEKDSECEFGKWLVTATMLVGKKNSLIYNEIVLLHGEFHKIAGKIASLVLSGHLKEAKKLMAPGGKYESLSNKLIQILNTWDI